MSHDPETRYDEDEEQDSAEGDDTLGAGTDSLFDGDLGTLDGDLRSVLVSLLRRRYVAEDDNVRAWQLLTENQHLLQSRLNDQFLQLVVNHEYRIAYKIQAEPDGGDSFPTLLKDNAYSREQAVLMAYLRAEYRSQSNAGEPVVFVDRDKMLAEVESYLSISETQRSRSHTAAQNAIVHLYRSRILLKTPDPDRFRVSPVIELILSVDQLNQLEEWLIAAAKVRRGFTSSEEGEPS